MRGNVSLVEVEPFRCRVRPTLTNRREVSQDLQSEGAKHTLQEQGQESNEEHQEDRDDAAPDPVEDGDEVIASWLTANDIA